MIRGVIIIVAAVAIVGFFIFVFIGKMRQAGPKPLEYLVKRKKYRELIYQLANESIQIRDQAISLIKACKAEEINSILLEELKARRIIGDARKDIISILGGKQEKKAMPALEEIVELNEENEEIVLAAVSAIELIDSPQTEVFFTRLFRKEDLPESVMQITIRHVVDNLDAERFRQFKGILEEHSQPALRKRIVDVLSTSGNFDIKEFMKEWKGQVKCAKCNREISWFDCYWQKETPGGRRRNPLGRGNYFPRVFCPRCGASLMETGLDANASPQWVWDAEQQVLNMGKSEPPPPDETWGKELDADSRVPMTVRGLDIDSAETKEDSQIDPLSRIRFKHAKPSELVEAADKAINDHFKSKKNRIRLKQRTFIALEIYITNHEEVNPDVHAYLGLGYLFFDDFKMARKLLEAALEKDKTCIPALFGLGILSYRESRNDEQAIDFLDQALKRAPDMINACAMKAEVLRDGLKRVNSAWKLLYNVRRRIEYDERLKQCGLAFKIYLLMGEMAIFNLKASLNEAIQCLEEAVALNRNDYRAPMYLEKIYTIRGNLPMALEYRDIFEAADVGFGFDEEQEERLENYVRNQL